VISKREEDIESGGEKKINPETPDLISFR